MVPISNPGTIKLGSLLVRMEFESDKVDEAATRNRIHKQVLAGYGA